MFTVKTCKARGATWGGALDAWLGRNRANIAWTVLTPLVFLHIVPLVAWWGLQTPKPGLTILVIYVVGGVALIRMGGPMVRLETDVLLKRAIAQLMVSYLFAGCALSTLLAIVGEVSKAFLLMPSPAYMLLLMASWVFWRRMNLTLSGT